MHGTMQAIALYVTLVSCGSIVGIRRAGEDMAAQQEGKRQGEAEHVGNAYLDPDVDPSFRLPEVRNGC